MQLGLGWIFVGAYRGDPPIRNSQFPIWAKGEGDFGVAVPIYFKKLRFILFKFTLRLIDSYLIK